MKIANSKIFGLQKCYFIISNKNKVACRGRRSYTSRYARYGSWMAYWICKSFPRKIYRDLYELFGDFSMEFHIFGTSVDDMQATVYLEKDGLVWEMVESDDDYWINI